MSSRRRPNQLAPAIVPTSTKAEPRPRFALIYSGKPIFSLAEVVGILVSASLASFASQLALHPLYGSIPTSNYFRPLLGVTCMLSTVPRPMPAHHVYLSTGVLLALAPLSAHYLGSWTGRIGNALLGPVLTQLVMVVPIIGLLSLALRGRLAFLLPNFNALVLSIVSASLLFVGIHIIEPLLWDILPLGGSITSCNAFLGLSLLSTLASLTSQPYFSFRRLLLLSFPLFLSLNSFQTFPCQVPSLPASYSILHNPNATTISALTGALGFPSSELEAQNITLRLLARQPSTTGMLVVGDFMDWSTGTALRYLRADHSILGGRWLGPKMYGYPGGESIYGTFVQQEAIRFVTRQNFQPKEDVLIIGLGVGIAASALINHGNKVHIVEIDPMVYSYAHEFFGLQEPASVHFMDARKWVHYRHLLASAPISEASTTSFPMIIHDCFSGGGVPSHLFTMEFWEELKGIMTNDGVVAVNFVGHLETESAKAIWYTLQEAFGPERGGRGCRVYHDVLPSKQSEHKINKTELLNMVYFCQKGISDEGVKFRKAEKEDLLDSYMRAKVFETMGVRELRKEEMIGKEDVDMEQWILRDGKNKLGEWQKGLAIGHWGIMRHVLPPPVWEIY